MSGDANRAPARLALSVALLAGAVIAYEVVLTRFFSFLLQYHYSFLVISGAVFGIGLGALAVARVDLQRVPRMLPWLALATSLTMAAGGAVILRSPRAALVVLAVAAALPLVTAGGYLALLFRAWGRDSQRLYGWDLAGAALGTAWVVPALDLGPVALAVCMAGAALAAGLAATPSRGAPAFAIGGLIAALATGLWLDVDLEELAAAADKPMFRGLSADRNRGQIVETRWSAYARTDLVDRTGETGLNMYLDGAAGSYLFRFDGDLRRLFFLRGEATAFPYYFGPRERVLVMGPGGGVDVLYGLLTGWRQIDGIEVNADAVRMVRDRPDYAGGLYDLRNVDIRVGDGRALLAAGDRRYDLIALPLVYAEAADLVGYQLAENYLFTREAFAAYLAHLRPGGRLSLVVHDHELMVRAVATLDAVFVDAGLAPGAVLDRLVVLNGARARAGVDRAYRPLLLVQAEPFAAATLDTMVAAADELGLSVYFAPGRQETAPLSTLRSGRLLAPGIDTTPVTDQRPYFYDVTPGVDSKLLVALGVAAALTLLATLGGLRGAPPQARRYVPVAASLGAGYMLVEVFLLQGLTLRLGHPVLALVVTLFGLLLATGVGSWLGRRLPLHEGRGLAAALAGCAVVALLVTPAPALLAGVHAWPLAARVAACLAVVVPTGLVLGLVFPAALAQAGLAEDRLVAWMWAVNGAASVLGSVGAVVCASAAGSGWIPLAGALCYAGAALVVPRGGPSAPSSVAEGLPWRLVAVVLVLWGLSLAYTRVRYTEASRPAAEVRPAPPPVPVAVWPEALGRR